MKSGSIFKTKYITWNNMGLPKQDADLAAYQLLAETTNQLGIHEGTVLRYHQTQAGSETYLSGLNNLQYDLLYGKRYAYHGEDPYPASELTMDVEDVVISSVSKNTYNNTLTVYGSNFTKNTKIFVNGSKVATNYLTPSFISTSLENVEAGDLITVNILGSKSIILREGVGEIVYTDPDVIHETETTETETTETETQSSETTDSEAPSSEKTDAQAGATSLEASTQKTTDVTSETGNAPQNTTSDNTQ